MKWKKWAKSWLCNYTSKQYFHYVKMPTLNKHVPSFNNQSKTFTHLCLALSHFIVQLWFVWVSLVHLCKPLCASLPKTEMSARPGKHRARLTNNRTEREVFVHRPLPCCAKLFFQLGGQKCQRRIRKCQSLQAILKSCERTFCSGGRHETKSEVCIKFGYLISMSFFKAHLAKW